MSNTNAPPVIGRFPQGSRWQPWGIGLSVYLGTTLLLLLATYAVPLPGSLYVPRPSMNASGWERWVRWDGEWYVEIVSQGYSYHPGSPSRVAFFPLYPLLGWVTKQATGWSAEACLLGLSHLTLAMALVLLACYEEQRGTVQTPRRTAWILVAVSVMPHSFFQRMAYSESLFLLLCVLTLWGMERHWPLVVLTALVSLATATRAVGLSLLLPLSLHVWRSAPDWRKSCGWLALLLPLGSSGLIAYMAYQKHAFGAALAFAQTQRHWAFNTPVPWSERLASLLAYEPIWSLADPESPCGRIARWTGDLGLLFPAILDRVAFVLCVLTLGMGIACGWLTTTESALSVGLIVIPYLTRGHEMCMSSMGRFTSVIFPLTLLQGRLIARMPLVLRVLILGTLAVLMSYAAREFAAGKPFL